MLLKWKEDIGPQLAKLDELLRLRLSPKQRAAIERESKLLLAGARAEREAAFQINFRLKDSKKWMVIHDLRLGHKGRTAQIDHLIIYPGWDFYVVETKGIHAQVRIEKGQWSFFRNGRWRGMANPVEQNARHILVLKQVLRDFDWLPRTMGIPVVPRFISVVVVPPECLVLQEHEHQWVLHMDELVTKARWDFPVGGFVCNLVHFHSGEDAKILGNKLVALHRPFEINYEERFGVRPVAQTKTVAAPAPQQSCECCKGPLSKPEAFFCRVNKDRFAGQMLCRKCQGYAPPGDSKRTKVEPSSAEPRCEECGSGVDNRVFRFCKDNAGRFGGRVLCRACQRKADRPWKDPAASNQPIQTMQRQSKPAAHAPGT
jgi:Nuclease-related domain